MEKYSGQFSFALEILFFIDYNSSCTGSRRFPTRDPGVAQLVGRLLWEQEAARSSRATRTKKALSQISPGGKNEAAPFLLT